MTEKEFLKLNLPVAAAVVEVTAERRIGEANGELAELTGYTQKELTGMHPRQLIYGKDYPRFEDAAERTLQEGLHGDVSLRLLRADQTVRWVQLLLSKLEQYDVKPRMLIFFCDVDAQMQRKKKHILLERKYELMEELSREYPFDIDVENRTMLRSRRLMELRGDFEYREQYYPVEKEVQALCPPDQQPFLEAMREASRRVMSGSIETRFNTSTGNEPPKYMWFRTFYRSVANEEGAVVRIIGRSFCVETSRTLKEEVRRDPLTKLLNKMEIQRETDIFLKTAMDGVHAVFLIDIDDFKEINDKFGHTFGDTVIVDSARTIKASFRTNDLVGRVGGDEFLVLMKDTTAEKAKERAEALGQALCRTYSGGELRCGISVSIGLALCKAGDGSTYSQLFEKADHAMYRAKEAGKNNYEVAGDKDIGPIAGSSRSIERRDAMSTEDREFLAFAISLMAHAKNIDGSLNMLLKRIAERYQLDLVMVFEDEADDAMLLTNYYGSEYSFYGNSRFPKKNSILMGLQPGDYAVVNNTRDHFSEGLGSYLRTAGQVDDTAPYSAVAGKFEYVGDCTGEIIYLSCDEERAWQPAELESLQELTRMIAVFVSLRYRTHESNREIRFLQQRDQLTELFNQDAFRRVALEELEKADDGRVYAIEYLDINNFGYINENYGYKIGDSILKLFTQDVREQGYFVAGCRLYSDFFLFLVADLDRETLIDHLCSRNKRFTNMQNHRYPNSGMGISAGIYFLDDPKADMEQAVENASLAWKQAKSSVKRDIVVYDSSLRSRRVEEQRVVGEFFEALYRDDFQMYLQPKFILGERTVYGAEALSRWKRPNGEIVPPAVFIDSLEKIGYIKELDFYIYEEVLKTLDKWERQGRRRIVISTNFSGRHFEGDGEEFLTRIRHVLSKYSVNPALVEIEVTESVLVKNDKTLEKCMDALHEMGFRIAIDDFGTGYSSLSVLADMPADVVKIDKSFIDKEMTKHRKDLLWEIGRMIRVLEKDVIVEGVETETQESFLREGGFTCGQGYLCNRPIPLGDFERMYL